MVYHVPVFDNTFVFKGHRNVQVRSDPGFGSVSQDYGSIDPDPNEIFTDSQHRAVF